MNDSPSRYTELLLDFGLEGLIPIKWCRNQIEKSDFLPSELFILSLTGTTSLTCLTICESLDLKIIINILQNGRDF